MPGDPVAGRPDAYSYSGGLNRASQDILVFIEMFKAPIKMLHPLLTTTQKGNYIGTESIGAISNSVILAQSNKAAWQIFKTKKNNEAFIDRICCNALVMNAAAAPMPSDSSSPLVPLLKEP